MDKYVLLEKEIGETPLSCAEKWRAEHPAMQDVPLSYAGRLDPMASGKLLVLIGEECKNQTAYHGLDKEYVFSVLLGISSDSLDVLGRLQTTETVPEITEEQIKDICSDLVGKVTLPYPKFSAKTVQGKPLHMWTLEGKLHEIEIPTKDSEIYSLTFNSIETVSKDDLVEKALEKVNSIPEVTDPRKALGNDFRRTNVRSDWNTIKDTGTLPETYQILHFTCIASSGTYMRTLAEILAKKLGTRGLAWSIHRSNIGTYNKTSEAWEALY